MKKEIIKLNVDPQEFGIEPTQAFELTKGLKPILEERNLLIEEFNRIKDLPLTKENIPIFRELRIKFQKNRTQGINNWHKAGKEVSLRTGQLLDAIKRNENQTNETHEEYLERGEKHLENLEKERKEKLKQERTQELSNYCENPQMYPLGELEEVAYSELLSGLKMSYEAKVAAEKKAEEERLAEIERQKLITENRNQLLPYSQWIENFSDINFEQVETEQVILEAKKVKLDYEKKQAEIAAENEKLRKEAEAKEKALQQERAKIEAERKAAQARESKLQAELKAKQEAEEARKIELERIEREKKLEAEKAAKAPIKTKLNLWVDSLEIGTPPIDNEQTKSITEKFNGFKKWAKSEIDKL